MPVGRIQQLNRQTYSGVVVTPDGKEIPFQMYDLRDPRDFSNITQGQVVTFEIEERERTPSVRNLTLFQRRDPSKKETHAFHHWMDTHLEQHS